MSNIRFVHEQGDLLDAAIARSAQRSVATRRARLRAHLRPHRRLAAVLVAVAVAGCGVAVAATGAFSSAGEKLALGRVDCFVWKGAAHAPLPGPTRDGYLALIQDEPLVGGQTPADACRQSLGAQRPTYITDLGLPALRAPRFLTCEESSAKAAVFIASGSRPAARCSQLGLTPLPASYGPARAALKTLDARLLEQYRSRDCWQPPAFVHAAGLTLAQAGFTGWHVIFQRDPRTFTMAGGRCALLSEASIELMSGGFRLSAHGSRRQLSHTLVINSGIPRSLAALVTRERPKLTAATWNHCYSGRGLSTLAQDAFGSGGLNVKVATTANPWAGRGFRFQRAVKRRHYGRGCPVFQDAWPTTNDRTMLVWFIKRGARPTSVGRTTDGPPVADFHR